jgi:hypothetical protein
LSYYERAPRDSSLDTYYEQRFPTGGDRMRAMMEIRDPHAELQHYAETDPFKSLAAAGEKLAWDFERGEVQKLNHELTVVRLLYRCQLAGERQMPLLIEMERHHVPHSGQNHWRVRKLENRATSS